MFNTIEEFIVWIESQKRMSPKKSLDKMRSLAKVLGNPHEDLKIIHIGGTNGKGSTLSFLKNILIDANLNVGTFTSPYVLVFNERIGYNHSFITDEEVLYYSNLLVSYYPKFTEQGIELPTFFEFLTLLSFLYFKDKQDLDVVIIEVGLGGLLDSTNILTPLASVITNVSFDHVEILGHTKQEIALNKLGIVKEGVPLFTIYDEEIFELFREVTEKKNSKLSVVKEEDIQDVKISLENTTYSYQDYNNINLSLLGMHQVYNSILALEVSRYLKQANIFKITKDNIYNGLKKTFWPARLEIVSKDPFIIIDGAHNEAGVKALFDFLNQVKNDTPIRLIYAASENKDNEEMIKILEPIADEVIFTEFSYKRSDTAEHLYSISKHSNKKIEYDLNKILHQEVEATHINCFAGSLYFVSEIRKLIVEGE